jgi:hypothetical protein
VREDARSLVVGCSRAASRRRAGKKARVSWRASVSLPCASAMIPIIPNPQGGSAVSRGSQTLSPAHPGRAIIGPVLQPLPHLTQPEAVWAFSRILRLRGGGDESGDAEARDKGILPSYSFRWSWPRVREHPCPASNVC